VLSVGATPVFADIDGDTLNIAPAQIEAAITPRTRAMIPVHIAGRPADMDGVREIAARHGLRVLEDAAQAHGAAWRGVRVGALGDLGTFSFQASKNLNAGEGGMIVSNDEQLADAAWSVMNVGRVRSGRWYEHHVLGSNFRLTEFQAALLRVQLQRLPEQMARRTANAAALRAHLSAIPGIRLPAEDPRITAHAYHLFTFRVDPAAFGGRPVSEIIAALNAEGVPCSSGYVPLYRERLFARYAAREGAWCQAGRRIAYPDLDLPVCAQVCRDSVWLFQTLLLAEEADMAQIATAVEKVRCAFA
jgi:dTDP-4-amino-4,6-dideoxygalactose transaminase